MAGSIVAGQYFYGLLFLVLTFLTLHEFYRFFPEPAYSVQKFSGIITGSLIFILSYLCFSGMLNPAFFTLIIPAVLFICIAGLYRTRDNTLISAALLIFGWIYIAIPYSISAWLAFPDMNNHIYTPGILLGLLCLIWLNDTGAYVFGMLFGKHRLFERISPKKSWEGFIGGAVFTVILGYFLNYFAPVLPRMDWIILSLLVSVFGVFGDLFESLLKRNAGVKDSGSLMPGHGGLLDRMDSLLFIIPISFTYLKLKTVLP